MKYDLILRDATIVSSRGRVVADVAIRDGRIAYVGPRPPRRAAQEISAIGKFLMPGVIDTAVQFDPEGNPQTWEQESKAAVTGGITTVIGLPGGKTPITDRPSAQARLDLARGRSWCNFGLWGIAAEGNETELSSAAAEGLIIGALAFMGEGAMTIGAPQLERYMAIEGVLGVQVDSDDVAPDVAAVIRAARDHNRRIHLVHLSTATELQLLDPVYGDIPVTAGVTPHHLFLSLEEDQVVTRPPVRPEQDRRTLWTAVKRGRLDCVASDHHPSSNGHVGVPGAELLFPLMLSAVKYGRLSLELLVSLCAEQPAEIFDLKTKGRIAKGADADLILFSEGEVTKVNADRLISGAGWSPYDSREAAPKPELVIVNGSVVASRGSLVGEQPMGRIISRGAPAEA